MTARTFAAALTLALGITGAGSVLHGCASINTMIAGLEKPTATLQGVKLGNWSADRAVLNFDVQVANPYGVDLPLADIDYSLAAKGASFVTGRAPMTAGAIPAHGSRVITIPAGVVFKDVLAEASGVSLGDVVPYTASLGLSFNTPGGGALRLPIEHSGELPVPSVPKVELAGVQWGEVSLQSAEATLKVNITNTNRFPLELQKLGYALGLEGNTVFTGNVAQSKSLAPGEQTQILIPVKASAAKAGLALLEMVRRRDASYSISGLTELGTRFGPISLPFDQKGTTAMGKK